MVRIYELNYEGLCLYVGRTTQELRRRFCTHMLRTRQNKAGSKYIPDELRPFEIKLLEECSYEQQIAREQHFYDTRMPLYNIQRPGEAQKDSEKKYKHSERGKELRRVAERRRYAEKKALTDTASYAEQT